MTIERSGPCSCGVGLDDGDDLDRHSIQCAAGWASPEGARKVRCKQDCEEEHRAALTRALTAQAWAVACATLTWVDGNGYVDEMWEEALSIADLPAPAELAADILDP